MSSCALLKLEQQLRRDEEMQLVREVTVTAVKNPQVAVTGDEATLKALQAGRVWKLVYADGFTTDGGQCKNCHALFADRRATCGYCGGAVDAVDDLTDRLVERASACDARVKVARDAAAELLRKHGSIGAFLRF